MRVLFSRGRKNTDKFEPVTLKVNNCGSHKEVDKAVEVFRQNGRVDYHLIFVAKGELIVDGKTYRDGYCALYRPSETHDYTYKEGENSAYYWLHFTGIEAESVVRNFTERCVSYKDKSTDVNTLLEMLLTASVGGNGENEEYLTSLLRAICSLITLPQTPKPFASVIAMMNDFSMEQSLSDYAKASFMSEGNFSRAFKQAYGVTPLQYKTQLKIDYAKYLLVGTLLKISEISAMSGFSDSLYFSRVFKKQTGVSPEQYRRKK
jgi:AraC-like DNA-binding protein